jgi:glucose uptake protein
LAILLNAFAYRKVSQNNARTSTKGLLLSVVSGCMMGLFYKYVAASMFPDFEMPEAGKLSPYSAMFLFSIGILLSNFLFNSLLMRKPFTGSPVTYGEYFKGSSRNHWFGILGGMIWGTGMAFNIIASGRAGPAISYGLGQGATVVAAIWGIYIWKEFKDPSSSTRILLKLMLMFYIVGLLLIILAR